MLHFNDSIFFAVDLVGCPPLYNQAFYLKKMNTKENQHGDTYTDSYTGMEFVKVKAGIFTMGSTLEQGDDCFDIETPSHQVTLTKDYYMGKYPVTQAQWVRVMDSNYSYHKNCNNCPVERVNWKDIQDFLMKLNAELKKSNSDTKQAYRLPTEAEWEYAARGGAKSKGYKYAGSDNIDAVAWYRDNSEGKTHPVGQKQPNELGLYDMSGNVWEWCADWYGDYTSIAKTDPKDHLYASQDRVYRGGSWGRASTNCRVAFRNYTPPGYRINTLGFRLCLAYDW